MEERLKIQYTCTNESLDAIMTALKPSSSDRILAVAGSGDQSFALMEHAPVTAVDRNSSQITFMKARLGCLQHGDYARFLSMLVGSGKNDTFGMAMLNERNKYFQAPGRLETLKDCSENLTIERPADAFDLAQTFNGLTKVYLSNALTYVPFGVHAEILQGIAKNLPKDGLIYSSCRPWLRLPKSGGGYFGMPISEEMVMTHRKEDVFLPEELELDVERTLAARKKDDHWTASVYRVR